MSITHEVENLPGTDLDAEHREYLVACGMSEEYLDQDWVQENVRSVRTLGQLPSGMHWGVDADAPSGILFGYLNPASGTVNWQFRPDHPSTDSKYVQEKGTGSIVALRSRPLTAQPVAHTVWIVEGTKQALAAAAALLHDPGQVVIGIAGADNWRGSGKQLHPGIAKVLPGCEQVYIVPDSDVAANKRVYTAFKELGEAVRGRMKGKRGRVHFISVPMSPGQHTAGLDDVLSNIPTIERRLYLDQLRDEALSRPADNVPSSDTARQEDDRHADPRFYSTIMGGLQAEECAAEIAKRDIAQDAVSGRLYSYNPETGLYVGDRNAGRDSTPALVSDNLSLLLKNDYRHTYDKTVQRILDRLLHEAGRVIPEFPDLGGLLPISNGLLDMESGRVIPFSPEVFVTTKLDVEYDPTAECPIFDKWLADATQLPEGGDQSAIVLDGLTTLLDTAAGVDRPTVALYLYGVPRGGKGTLGEVVKSFVAPEHRTAMSLADMAKDKAFDNADLYRKILNVSGETADKYVDDTSLMKKVFGGDEIAAELKYGKAWKFTAAAATVFMGNDLPHISDTSGATSARLLPVRFTKSNVGREDRKLLGRLIAEKPGILNRLLEARAERIRRGNFLKPAASASQEFLRSTNPVAIFVEECLYVTPPSEWRGNTVPAEQSSTITDLYTVYKNFAQASGTGQKSRERFRSALLDGPWGIRAGITPKSDGQRRVLGATIRKPEASGSISMSTGSGVTVAIPANVSPLRTSTVSGDVNTEYSIDPAAGMWSSTVADEAQVPAPAPVAEQTVQQTVPTDDPALALLTDAFWALLASRVVHVPAPQVGDNFAAQRHYSVMKNTPASVTLTEVSSALGMPAPVARNMLRAVADRMESVVGVALRERRLGGDDLLGKDQPLTGQFVPAEEKARIQAEAKVASAALTEARGGVKAAEKASKAAARALAAAEKRYAKDNTVDVDGFRDAVTEAEQALDAARTAFDVAEQHATEAGNAVISLNEVLPTRTGYAVIVTSQS